MTAHERIARPHADVGVIGEEPIYAKLKEPLHLSAQVANRRCIGA
jgi:hypothetical protein